MPQKRTSARAFHDAAGVDDWRVLFSGAHAHFLARFRRRAGGVSDVVRNPTLAFLTLVS
jgi:hypothetical protein